MVLLTSKLFLLFPFAASAGAKESAVTRTRAETEQEGSLVFDGFLSFNCKTRADSLAVVRLLSVCPVASRAIVVVSLSSVD